MFFLIVGRFYCFGLLKVCSVCFSRTDVPDGVSRTAFDQTRKGPGSISSSIGKAVSDDEMSLDNYANVNPGKFSEDGSFIGQYNPNRRIIQMQPGIPESAA